MDSHAAQKEKNFVALTSLLAAIGITAFKIVVGLATNSLGILAEAAHSGFDLVAAAMTCWAVRKAVKPADREHRFGHGKFENLSALFETLLLIITCVWITYHAVHRLIAGTVEVEITYWSFVVMITSIVVDYSRSRALRKAATKHNSQALEADALHFETDIWSSAAVIIGLGCVWISSRAASLRFLEHGDAVAAIMVGGVAAVMTVRLGIRTMHSLLDWAPPGLEEKVRAAAEAIPGVCDCHQIRIRTAGPQVFADIHVTMDGNKTLSESHALADQIELAIQREIPMADVTVHTEPLSERARE